MPACLARCPPISKMIQTTFYLQHFVPAGQPCEVPGNIKNDPKTYYLPHFVPAGLPRDSSAAVGPEAHLSPGTENAHLEVSIWYRFRYRSGDVIFTFAPRPLGGTCGCDRIYSFRVRHSTESDPQSLSPRQPTLCSARQASVPDASGHHAKP